MTLKEKAQEAYQEALARGREQEEEARQEEAEKARLTFVGAFGVEPERVDGSLIYVEGLEIRRHVVTGRRPHFTLLGDCPNCSRRCDSVEFADLAELGLLLAEFRPAPNHHCYGSADGPKRDTWQDKLAAAIIEAIEERLPSIE